MEKEINLRIIFDTLKKRIWWIVIITALFTMAGGLYSSLSPDPIPLYRSSASILLSANQSDLQTLEVISKDPVVLENVIEELELNTTSDELKNQIAFTNVNDSRIINISVIDKNPELAVQIANITTKKFMQQIGNILGIYDSKILSEAKVKENPTPINETSKSPIRSLVIAFGIGFVLSIGIVLFLDSLDNTAYSKREIEQLLDLPVLGSVSVKNRKNTGSNRKLRRRKEWPIKKEKQA